MSTHATVEQFQLPRSKRFINWAGDVLNQCGINLVDLSEESLMKKASHKTGLSDWGDPDFYAPFRVLLDSYEKEANLSLIGKLAMQQECTRALSNRLYIQEAIKKHPEIKEIPVKKPLFIVGLPRTGTTMLHHLLCQDQNARIPFLWEFRLPSFPSASTSTSTQNTQTIDPRIKMAEESIRRFYTLAPQVQSIHTFDPTGPTECIQLFQNIFMSPLFSLYSNIPQYEEWLLHHEHDMVLAYKYYRQILQLLQRRHSGKYWVLKSPAHIYALDALLNVFPDACVILTHRDPLKVVPSYCSMSAVIKRVFSDHIDLKELGKRSLSQLGEGIDRMMKVREAYRQERFYDVSYEDLIADPLKIVRRIYSYFNLEFDSQKEEIMKAWFSANPKNKHGAHKYTLDHFGLDQETIRQRFSSYMKKFNLCN